AGRAGSWLLDANYSRIHDLTPGGRTAPEKRSDSLLGRVSSSGVSVITHLPSQPSRIALAATLHDLFMLAALVAIVSLIVSVFLREVPLTEESQTRLEEIAVAA
ncbi:MAG TPA: hypothetical protein VLU92_02960, partial [Candidatus Dormibacteraeota bacterium]|nr:hypothetical protein [Candidatus Dormibacteraeota bacterium]